MQLVKCQKIFLIVVLCTGYACVRRHHGGSNLPTSGLSADIEGMGDSDRALEGLTYTLQCNSNQSNAYSVKGTAAKDSPRVDFPDQQINPGDRCALEVTATAQKSPEGPYVWLARKGQQPVVGLFYSSDLGTVQLVKMDEAGQPVQKKYLSLKLIKTYAIDYQDKFDAAVTMDLEMEQGGFVPDYSGAIATLICPKNGLSEPIRESTNRMAKQTGGASDFERRTFTFGLSARAMQNQTCSRVEIAIEGALTHIADPVAFKFTTPKASDTPSSNSALNFGPTTAKLAVDRFGEVVCSSRSADSKACQAVSMGHTQPIWFALAEAKIENRSDAPVFWISPKLSTFGPDLNSNVFNFDEVKQSALELSSNLRFQFHEPGESSKLLVLDPFDVKPIQDFKSKLHAIEDFKGTMLAGSIKTVYVHGMRAVPEPVISAKSSARWFAHVQVQGGKKTEGFVVTGSGPNFFESTAKPQGQRVFFSTSDFRDHSDHYRVFAYKDGGFFSELNCTVPFMTYTDVLSRKFQSDLAANSTDSDVLLLKACEVRDPKAIASFFAKNTGALTHRYYLWDWHEFKF